jgi:hypothetical protein
MAKSKTTPAITATITVSEDQLFSIAKSAAEILYTEFSEEICATAGIIKKELIEGIYESEDVRKYITNLIMDMGRLYGEGVNEAVAVDLFNNLPSFRHLEEKCVFIESEFLETMCYDDPENESIAFDYMVQILNQYGYSVVKDTAKDTAEA